MVKNIFLFAVLFIYGGYLSGWGQAYSTSKGGPWSAPSTWQDGVIPTAADDVVLVGPVQLDAGGDYYIHSLTVEPNGKLTLVTNLPETRMHVTQDVFNKGKIIGKSSLTPLYFYVGGDVINYGEWRTYDINFTDTLTHLLRAEPGSSFSPLRISADSARIVSDRDAFLDSVDIVIRELELRPDYATQEPTTFYFRKGSILHVKQVFGQDNAIAGDKTSYITYAPGGGYPDFYDIHIKGETVLGTNFNVYGSITIDDTLRLMDSFTSDKKAIVTGDIINNGALIENNLGYAFQWECEGNVRNLGIWRNHPVTITGVGSRTLYIDINQPFTPLYFEALDVTIVSESSLRFDDSSVKIKNLKLQPGHDLYFHLNTYFQVDSLIGNFNRIHFNDNARLLRAVSSSTAPVLQNVILTGTARLTTNVVLEDTVTVEGTLRLPDQVNTSYTVTVNGILQNFGSVALNNWGYGLDFTINGSVKSTGEWQSNRMDFTGVTLHHLYTPPQEIFDPGLLDASDATIISDTTLHFDDATIEISKLILQPGHDLILNPLTILRVDTLEGNNNTLFCRGGSFISYAASSGVTPLFRNISLDDTVNITRDIIFENQVINNGTLKIADSNNNNYIINVRGNIINNGYITPNNWNYLLGFMIEGDLENQGYWETNSVELQGTQMQQIIIPDTSKFQANIKIHAMRNGNQYQWLRDGQPLSNTANIYGTTSNILTLQQITTQDYGTYKCQIDSSGQTIFSREVNINSGVTEITEPQISLQTPSTFSLFQNFPNPFNPVTTIQYQLPYRTRVQLIVYDILGRQILQLVDKIQPAGYYSVQFDASHLSSGTYFYRLITNEFTQIRKMNVIK